MKEILEKSLLELYGGEDFESAGFTPIGGACYYRLNRSPFDIPECDKTPAARSLYAACLGIEGALSVEQLYQLGWSCDTSTGFVSSAWLLKAAINNQPLPSAGCPGSEWSGASVCEWIKNNEHVIAVKHPRLYKAFAELSRHLYSGENMTLIPLVTRDGSYCNRAKGCGGLFGSGRIYDQFSSFLELYKRHESELVSPEGCPGFDDYVRMFHIPLHEFDIAHRAYKVMMEGEGEILGIDELSAYFEALNAAYDKRRQLLLAAFCN